jgi:GNAT superfamily N-acetyltransferase
MEPSDRLSAMEIHEALPEEYDQVGEVVSLAYGPFGSTEDQDWMEHLHLVREVADRATRTVVLAAVEDGRVVGSATIEMFDVIGDDDRELPPGWAFLRMVGVHPDVQGKGVGKALIQEVIGRAAAAGKKTIGLRTGPHMRVAHRLYESLGFVREPSLDYKLDDESSLLGYRLDL